MIGELPIPEDNSFSVIVIHNGDKVRLGQTFRSLFEFLGPSWQSEKLEVLEEQPSFTSMNRKFVFNRTLYSLLIALNKQVRLKKPLLGYLKVLAEHLLQLTQFFGPSWAKLQKRVFAELALTEKHIAAMKHISQNGSSGLVVEDDIQSAAEVDVSLVELQSIPTLVESNCVYVSLCVAFTVKQLGLENVIENGPPKFSVVSEGVANTTAAYWITKEFADNVLVEVASDSKLRLLAADWLITEAFSRIPESKCLYLDKGVFVNGSLFGLSQSEIRP